MLNQQQIEQVQAIVKSMMNQNYTSGFPIVPVQNYSGVGSLQVPPKNLLNFPVVESYEAGQVKRIAGGQFLTGGIGWYGFPIVNGFGVGTFSAFNGGDAPDGTIMAFTNATTNQLYIRIANSANGPIWAGVELNLLV